MVEKQEKIIETLGKMRKRKRKKPPAVSCSGQLLPWCLDPQTPFWTVLVIPVWSWSEGNLHQRQPISTRGGVCTHIMLVLWLHSSSRRAEDTYAAQVLLVKTDVCQHFLNNFEPAQHACTGSALCITDSSIFKALWGAFQTYLSWLLSQQCY